MPINIRVHTDCLQYYYIEEEEKAAVVNILWIHTNTHSLVLLLPSIKKIQQALGEHSI